MMSSPTGKKTALMLSGHFRQFENKIVFWRDFVEKYSSSVDIYIHTWNEAGTNDPNEGPPDFSMIKCVLNPVKMQIDEHPPIYDSFSFKKKGLQLYYAEIKQLREDINSDFSRSIGSQLYSIMKCWELVRDTGNQYDYLIRLRADSVLLKFENFMDQDTTWITDDVLIVNSGVTHRHHGGGGGCGACDKEFEKGDRKHKEHKRDICDIFALGKPDVMERLCTMYLHRVELVESFRKYNENAIKDPNVNKSLVKHKGIVGVKFARIYESSIKAFYPERLIREYMKHYWILSDPMGLIPNVMYNAAPLPPGAACPV